MPVERLRPILAPAARIAVDELWAVAQPAMAARWPGPVGVEPPDWDGYDVYLARDAAGVQFGIATIERDYVYDLPGWPDLRLGSELHLYIGPRAGLTPTEFVAANLKCLRLWLDDLALTRPPGYRWFGIVPAKWNGNFRAVYTDRIGTAETPMGAWTVLHDSIGHTRGVIP